jgi:hypothetical protein
MDIQNAGWLQMQGVEPIWLEKGLFWLETNKMAGKKVKFPNIISVKCTEMVLLCTHEKKYRVSPVDFMSIAFFFIRENRCPKTNTHCDGDQQDGGKKSQISTPVSAFSAIVGVSLKCVL